VDFSSLAGSLEDETQRSPTERRVAQEIFVPLLAVPRFGIHDNFFALGGTSLQAIQVISRVRSVFGVEIPVAEFFQNPTVSGIATAVDRLRSAKAAATDDDLLAALAEVEGRSDEEIERMLGVS
jgi:acyl carrier protein